MSDINKKPEDLTLEELEAIIGGAAAGVGGTTSVNMQNIQSMDIETALMMVQSERTKLLDTQLQTQIQEVQNRNIQVANLNDVLSSLNAVDAKFNGSDKADVTLGSHVKGEEHTKLINAVATEMKEAGITGQAALTDGELSKGEVSTMISQVKGMIDAAGNSQQMDMLRLQSMSNKRNEAFDVMTNFVKKMQDSRSSIIGNMR
jgi:hypothetical protein